MGGVGGEGIFRVKVFLSKGGEERKEKGNSARFLFFLCFSFLNRSRVNLELKFGRGTRI